VRTQAQTPSPSQQSTKAAETKPANPEGGANPFAPASAPPLPAGMTGSDPNDPRAKLTPGMYDAGEASMGMKHLMLLKKPDAFQLGTTDPDTPKVQKTLGLLGVGDSSKMPKPMQVVIDINTPHPIESARLAFHACNRVGEPFMYFWAHDSQFPMCRTPGTYRLVCDIPKLRLYQGNYNLKLNFKEYAGGREFDALEGVCPFEVVMYGREREGGWWKGTCAYLEDGDWKVEKVA